MICTLVKIIFIQLLVGTATGIYTFLDHVDLVNAFVLKYPASPTRAIDDYSTGLVHSKAQYHRMEFVGSRNKLSLTNRIRPPLDAAFSSAATTSNSDDDVSVASSKSPSPLIGINDTQKSIAKRGKTWKELREEGGFLTFNTPIGALNPFAMYYFFASVALGIPWFFLTKLLQIFYWITRNKFDKERRIPTFFGHCWGMALMRLTRCYPKIRNREIVNDFFKNGNKGDKEKCVMFVANHCSWMDIPFLGATMGWRNYKIVSKKELGIVPILGAAIRCGGHIMVDRTDRISQVKTLKQGINYLKEGVNLATFPEGTRSRTGRMIKFKAGAFKMAHKAGAPVFPISIVNSHKVMPLGWMMAMRPAYALAEVIIHPPILSDDKTEEELADAVRNAMIDGLPDYQKPLK